MAQYSIKGTKKDDAIRGTDKGEGIDVSQGGDDYVTAGAGGDMIFYGSTWDKNDFLDGGKGYDAFLLNGIYGELTISRANLRNVEQLSLIGDHNYHVTLANNLFKGNGEFTVTAALSIFGAYLYADASGVDHGSIRLFGSNGNDGLYGGGAHDNLRGALGADYLVGGAGDTVFSYWETEESSPDNQDLIANFTHGDLLDLQFIDANPGNGSDREHFTLGTASGHIGDLTVTYDSAAGETYIRGYTNNDSTPDLEIALLGDHSDLTTADFILA